MQRTKQQSIFIVTKLYYILVQLVNKERGNSFLINFAALN